MRDDALAIGKKKPPERIQDEWSSVACMLPVAGLCVGHLAYYGGCIVFLAVNA